MNSNNHIDSLKNLYPHIDSHLFEKGKLNEPIKELKVKKIKIKF